MGILARQQDGAFVIASDRRTGEARTKKPPRGKPSDSYEVWTGTAWTASMTDAKTFDTLDNADEYIRANFAQVTGQQ